MAIAITLPRQGWSMDEAAFVQWLKQDGDAVQAGEPLFAVETDKAVQEIESLDAGILRIPPDGPGPGDVVRVGDVIGYLVDDGEDMSTASATRADIAATRHAVHSAADPVTTPTIEPTMADEGGPMAAPPLQRGAAGVTPRAARRALQDGVDLRTVIGSGAGGRIRERDVFAASAATPRQDVGGIPAPTPLLAPVLPGDRDVPITGRRRTIAQRMLHSSTATAPVTLTTQVDATALVSLRNQFKTTTATDEPAPSLSDIVVKLVGLTLPDYPLLYARWDETRIVLSEAVNIGLAVDTQDGLLVPVIHDVPQLPLRQLAARTRDLVDRARRRQLTTAELTGGTFTVTNLGGLGVDAFTPIINHPECAVLGMGRIRRTPVVVDHQIVIRDQLWLSLTFDHRIVDGAPAARFLDAVRHAVESAAARLIG
jgi:pyruvate dehydrogenase E2 component (dihydrolipoamide acetyltransferase)